MENTFENANNWLSKNMFIIVLSGIFLGYLCPLPSTTAITTLSIVFFAYMTFISSLTMSFKKTIDVLSRPALPVWTLSLIHIMVPLFAWILGTLFYPKEFLMRLGLLVGGGIPTGVTSIIWTSLTDGNVALSLVTVTLDTIIIPILMPIYFALVVGKSTHLNYVSVFTQLAWMVTIPSIIGMAINSFTSYNYEDFCRSVGGFTSKIANFFVVYINASMILPKIHWNSSIIEMLFIVLLLVFFGYGLGLFGSLFIRDCKRDTVISMIFNTGIRNTSFGSVLAISYFAPTVALPIILNTLLQQPVAAIVSHSLTKYYRPEIIVLEPPEIVENTSIEIIRRNE